MGRVTNARVSRKTGVSPLFLPSPLDVSAAAKRRALSHLPRSLRFLREWKSCHEMNRPPRMSFLQATRVPSLLGLAFFFFSSPPPFFFLNDHCARVWPDSSSLPSFFRYYARDGCIRLLITVSFAFLECFLLERKWEDVEKQQGSSPLCHL